jgi:hypothetical protein
MGEPQKAPNDAADADDEGYDKPDSLSFYKEPDFDSIYRVDDPDEES